MKLRFSLRLLLLAVALCAVILGWLRATREADRFREAERLENELHEMPKASTEQVEAMRKRIDELRPAKKAPHAGR